MKSTRIEAIYCWLAAAAVEKVILQPVISIAST
jgi:hypothetical protein